ncbi:MAG: ATP-binding protein [Acidobacteriota bacterium]
MEKNTASAQTALRYFALTAIAAALAAVFSHVLRVNQTTVAMAFLVLVLVTAYRWRFAYSIYLSVLCTLLYNFFFLPPVGRLTIADPQNWIALGAFLCTSVLVSHLSRRERREKEAALARRREIELLYRLSQRLLVQDDFNELARSTPSIVASVFGLRAVALYVAAADTVFYSDPDRILLSSEELKSPAWSRDEPILEKDGIKITALRLGMRHELGRLAIADDALGSEMVEAIASLVSVALERAATLERSSHLEAARESERLRTAIMDSVTHDLRTPLTAIRAAATTLQSQPEMAAAVRGELVDVVSEESARLDRLIGQAIEMARLDTDSLRLNAQPQDVRELIELTVEGMRGVLGERPVEIRVPASLRPVWMDRMLMRRVLQHLLENAAAYSPLREPITIAAASARGRLVFTVEDRGPGIQPDELPLIFEKYYRGKRQKSSNNGTGMGLAIVQAILKVHHGGIEAESRPGQGACFRFWIPLAQPGASGKPEPRA